MKKILIFIFSLTIIYSYNQLSVNDPQSWGWDSGTIEEAKLDVTPQGIYMKYGLELVFSAKDSYLTDRENLEVVLDFELPAEAFVSDLWLWVGEDTSKAIILDKWTASTVYENIVNRRRDPAILSKNSATQYNLKVYPMEGEGTRKVRIEYFLPINFTSEKGSVKLPMAILKTSYNKLKNLTIEFIPTSDVDTPALNELEVTFSEVNDPERGIIKTAEINIENEQSLTLEFDSPMVNGMYLTTFDTDNEYDEKIYQLAMIPSQALELDVSKKVLFLFDHDITNSSITGDEVIAEAKTFAKNYLNGNDSLNILISNLNIKQLSNKWIPASADSIDKYFDQINLSSYSNLTGLLSKGVEFADSSNSTASLFLISNSDQVSGYEAANPLIDDLLAQMNPILPIVICDYGTDVDYNYFGGKYYYGNDYLYQNLSRKTKGHYATVRWNKQFSSVLEECFQSLSGLITSFDLSTSVAGGFCFSRINVGNETGTVYIDRPILQVGRFIGEMPFEITSAGIFNKTPFVENYTISDVNINNSGSRIWTGNQIRILENQNQSNDIVSLILEESIENRILSKYTSFLALEPGDSIENHLDDENDDDFTSVEDEVEISKEDYELTILPYPNPFNSQTRIKVNVGRLFKEEIGQSIVIYNLLGQKVKTFDISSYLNSDEFELTWNGTNDYGETVGTGVYYLVVTTNANRYTAKLMLLK